MFNGCSMYTTTAGRADSKVSHQERSFQLEDQLLCKQPPLPYKYAAGCDESEDKSGSYLVCRPSAAQLERSERGKNGAQENTKSRRVSQISTKGPRSQNYDWHHIHF